MGQPWPLSLPITQRLVLYFCAQVLRSTLGNRDILVFYLYQKNRSVHMRSAVGVSMRRNPAVNDLQKREPSYVNANVINHSKAYFTLSLFTCPSIPLSGNQSRQWERPPRALILSSGQTTSIRRPRLIASYTWFGSWICKHNVAKWQPSCNRILH